MQSHEYRVVPAARRGLKAKGIRRPEERFAKALEAQINKLADEGWEFVRSDTLPCEQKGGWFSRPVTVFQTMLVFRRAKAGAGAASAESHHAPRVNSAAMPPPVALAPVGAAPAPLPSTPTVAAPAASRFTPPPLAPRPANDAAPATMPPAQRGLTVIEHEAGATPASSSDTRHAAE